MTTQLLPIRFPVSLPLLTSSYLLEALPLSGLSGSFLAHFRLLLIWRADSRCRRLEMDQPTADVRTGGERAIQQLHLHRVFHHSLPHGFIEVITAGAPVRCGLYVTHSYDRARALTLNIGIEVIMDDVALPLQLPRPGKGVHQALYKGVYVDIRVELGIGHKQGVALPASAFEAHLPGSLVEIGLEDSFEDFTFL